MSDIPGVHVADTTTEERLRLNSLPTIRLYDADGNLLIWHSISQKDMETAFTPGRSLTVTLSTSLS